MTNENDKKFKRYKSATNYLIKEFDLKKSRWFTKLDISFHDIEILIKQLKKKLSLTELNILKLELESTCEQNKLLSPIVAMIALSATVLGLMLNNIINSRDSANKALAEINDKMLILKESDLTSEELRQQKLNNLLQFIDASQHSSNLSLFNSMALVTVGIISIIFAWVLYIGIKEVVLLKSIVSQAYEEKKDEEENKYRVTLSKQ